MLKGTVSQDFRSSVFFRGECLIKIPKVENVGTLSLKVMQLMLPTHPQGTCTGIVLQKQNSTVLGYHSCGAGCYLRGSDPPTL
jgi:hypothetical protein